MRVLILSPNWPDFAAGLAARLEQESVVTGVVVTAETTGLFRADLVIAREGAHIGEALRSAQQRAGLTMVVAPSADAETRIALLDRGCDYVLHGDVPLEEVVAQARAAARRLPPGPDDLHPGPAPIVLHARSRHAVVFGRTVPLTQIEWRLLSVLVAEPGRTFSSRELMIAAWGSAVGGQSTVSSYVRRLRTKIEPDPAHPTLIRTRQGAGYVFHPGPPPS